MMLIKHKIISPHLFLPCGLQCKTYILIPTLKLAFIQKYSANVTLFIYLFATEDQLGHGNTCTSTYSINYDEHETFDTNYIYTKHLN